MECKNCGAPLSEEDVFCGNCGSHVENKRRCHTCGHVGNITHNYCVKCGTRIDGKKICRSCKQLYEGNFCPICTPSIHASTVGVGKTSYGRIPLLLGAVLAFLSTFFIKLVPSEERLRNLKEYSVSIYSFFFRYYKNGCGWKTIKNAVETFGDDGLQSGLLESRRLFYGLGGTLLALVIFACVAACVIMALVRYAKSVRYSLFDTSAVWSMGAILSFLAGALFYRGYVSCDIRYINFFATNLKLSTLTLVTMAVCALCAVAGVALSFVDRREILLSRQNRPGTLASLSSMVLAVATALVGAKASFGYFYDSGAEVQQISFLRMGTTFMEGFWMYSRLDAERYERLLACTLGTYVFTAVAQVAMLCVILGTLLTVLDSLRVLQGKESRRFRPACFTCGSALVLLISDIVACRLYLKALDALYVGYIDSFQGRFQYGPEIVTLVLSVLLLAVCIVGCVPKQKKDDLNEK